ncbi:MAG TPA: hypothetical protein DCG75_03460 [Bacteroidales bacterium]|nr:hypothetical protein [Bacteroidales bacterium]
MNPNLKAEEKNDSFSQIRLTTIAQAHQGNSYVTILEGIGQIEHLWFEGNLIPSFYIRIREDSRLLGVLTPQVIIRMYQEESFPVRTPSYMPQATVYWSVYNKQRFESLNIFGRLAHHSNGQQGDFFLEDGSINVKTGNFSTNYIEAGVIKTSLNKRFNAVRMFRSSVQVHPPILSVDELDNIYSFYRWNNFIYIFKLNKSENEFNKSQKANISLKAELNWFFGDFNNNSFLDIDRITFSTTFTYHPSFFEDIVLFAQYYYGKDYYNMYFSNTLNVFRVGIMTELIRF